VHPLGEPEYFYFSGFPSSEDLNPSGDELINEARYVADALGYDFLRSSLNRDAEPECLGATGAINDEGRLFGASPIEQAIGTLAASSRRAMA
jgi:hypothetical protein